MRDIEGFILIGGASSRMGTNKALLSIDGRNFVDRTNDALGSVATKTTLVGPNETCLNWPSLPAIGDIHVEWGALGGLHSALSACRAEWAAVVACDLPFVTGELLKRLAGFREGADAVVPLQRDGIRQPLCALYRVIACRDRAEQLIADGERRPRALLDAVNTRAVGFEELSDLKGAERFFMNVNTPEDFAHARAIITGED
jgi:molybdopterin-guanine dinucleotide biosynthesis protein A